MSAMLLTRLPLAEVRKLTLYELGVAAELKSGTKKGRR